MPGHGADAANKQIASQLFISESTVKTQVTNIFQKLEVSHRTEAVTQALQRGMIKLQSAKGTVAFSTNRRADMSALFVSKDGPFSRWPCPGFRLHYSPGSSPDLQAVRPRPQERKQSRGATARIEGNR